MKIRGKLLILLLVIALIPLVLSAVFHQVAMRHLGTRLAADSRTALENRAVQFLENKVKDYARFLQRDQEALRLALEFQADEVSWQLRRSNPAQEQLFFAEDFDRGDPRIPNLEFSDRHVRLSPGGGLDPVPLSYATQAIYIVPGSPPQTIAEDLRRLAGLTEVYRHIHHLLPSHLYWQYTTLESGLHSSYPGHGGYPEGYDPRKRNWYRQAKASGELVRQVVIDATTGKPLLTLALPLYREDGTFLGVTAVDVAYERLFSDWWLPDAWAMQSESMVAVFQEAENAAQGAIAILLRSSLPGASRHWQAPPNREYFQSPNRDALKALMDDVRSGRTGVTTLNWRGRKVLLAYGPGAKGEPFPMVSVPYEILLEPAARAEAYFDEQIMENLGLYAGLLLGVVLWVVVTAYFRARSVTRPVTQLAEAATRLAGGDFEMRTDIRTGDELEDLGRTFNGMGPQLQERLELKQSLSIAREIQQMLLPGTPPQLPGFAIAGRTRYCDETGGDYFDFIRLDGNRMAVAVGDVSGHGVGPALLMAAARGVLRSQAARYGTVMNQLFTDLNLHLVEDTADSLFMTLFYGLIDGPERTLHWISAGHGPVLHLNASSGCWTYLVSTGIPLGIMPDATYETLGPQKLDPGDLLLVGTDGIWESDNPEGEMFGIDRLKATAEENLEKSAEDILDALFAAIEEFRRGTPQKDDLTMIVVRG